MASQPNPTDKFVMTRAQLNELWHRSAYQAASAAFDRGFDLGWDFGLSQQRNSGEERALLEALDSAREAARNKFLDSIWRKRVP